MKRLWSTIDDARGGEQTFQLGGPEVLYACLGGEATFPQTDAGWTDLRAHDFECHERITHYDLADLHGQEVTLLMVQRIDEEWPHWRFRDDATERIQTEMVARTKDGTYYFLPFAEDSTWDDYRKGGFKWKPQRDGMARLLATSRQPMPHVQESALLGFVATDE